MRGPEVFGSGSVWDYLLDKEKKILRNEFQKQNLKKKIRCYMFYFCLQMVVNKDSLDLNANIKFKFLT